MPHSRFALIKTCTLFTMLLFAAGSLSAAASLSVRLAQLNKKIGGGYAASGQLANVGYTSEIYDATNGLPTSDANFVLGARNGYVWICGYSGVIRYNGSFFERLPPADGLTSGRGLFEDSKGRIWVATNDNGVVVIDGEETRHYTYKDGLPSSSARIFAEDNDGNIFVGTTAGVCYINKNGQLYALNDVRLNTERVLKLAADYNGKIYGQTKDGKIFSIEHCMVSAVYTSEELNMEKITSLMTDPLYPGKVYVGTQGSAVYYGDFGKESALLKKIDVSPLTIVHWMSYDCGRIWISSTTMLGYLDENSRFHELQNIPMNSSIEMSTSDYQGNLWVASATQGIMKIVTNNFVNLSREASLPKETTNATCIHDGLLYIGTDHGLKILDMENRSIQNALTGYIGDTRIRCILEDSRKNLWIACYTNDKGLLCYSADGSITAFSTQNGMPNNQVRCIKETKDGRILAGTSGGLGIISGGKVVRTIGTEDIIKNIEFLTVEESNDGKIYIGSDGDGIYIIEQNDIKRLGREAGLTSDVILRIKKDKTRDLLWVITSNSVQYIQNGIVKNIHTFPYNNNYDLYFSDDDNCWILSSYGIFSVKTQDLLLDTVSDYRLYTIANGLPCAITSNSFGTLDTDGTLYIPGREGVIRVNINHYFDHNSEIKVDLNSILCDDEKINPNPNGNFVLPASKGRIKLMPSVLDYTMANPIVKVYLDGAKDSGIIAPKNIITPLEYTSLPYGDYTLHIQILAHNKKDVLLDKSFKIIKRPRMTELFTIRLLLLALLVLAAGIIVWRVMKTTVISRQYAELRQARDEAERANSAKSHFLSNMSQEILNPINTIMGMNEMIMREDVKGVPQSYFMSIVNYAFDIKTASESLYTVVNDLLELTKIESGKLQLVEQEYELGPLLKNVASFIRVKTSEKELTFTVSVDDMIPKRLYGDAGKIKQIILTLLSNAVRYTETGCITLKVSMEERIDNICGLRFSVQDTGIGIKPEEIENLFSTYERIVEHENAEKLQTGLGLNISRRFAELMGGVLVCQSDEGQGSDFIFAFEQKIVDATPIGTFSEQDDTMGTGPYMPQFIAPDADILVVDENQMTLRVISSLLKATKVFVTTATNCEDCLAKIRNSSFNVVFLNKNIPGIDGEEAIQKIREIAPDLPVYALTENTNSSEAYYKEKGFTGSIPFPLDTAFMERSIMRHLPEAIMAHPTKNDKIEVLSDFPPELLWIHEVEGISVPAGLKASGGIGPYIMSLNLFFATIDDNVSSINSVYQKGDFALYAVKARILKNSAQFIGAERLFALAQKVEEACKKDDRIFVAANTDLLLAEYSSFKEKLSRLRAAHNDADGEEKGAAHV